jgi:hypothetical protein
LRISFPATAALDRIAVGVVGPVDDAAVVAVQAGPVGAEGDVIGERKVHQPGPNRVKGQSGRADAPFGVGSSTCFRRVANSPKNRKPEWIE